jgi:hypothetical protein
MPGDRFGTCHYCSIETDMTRDHVVPASLGGPESTWNIVPSCAACNYQKADQWPTCGCEKCVAAVERFLGDPRFRANAVRILRRRIRELGDQMASIERAGLRIGVRREKMRETLELLS